MENYYKIGKLTLKAFLIYLLASLCMFATLFMVAYWCYEFGLNEDLSIVTYSESTEGKDKIYPTMSMCLQNPFKKDRLTEYGVNQSIYLEFLIGIFFSKKCQQSILTMFPLT